MDHSEIRHSLSGYLDGSLVPAEHAAVEEHLRSCRECSEALRELQKTVEHLRGLEQVEPPAWMTQKIMARVREHEEERKGFLHRLFFPLYIKLPLEAVGVALVAVTAFFVYQNTLPVDRYSETAVTAPQRTAPAQAAPDLSANDAPGAKPQAVPQKPGYRAMDMKDEYGSPPPAFLEKKKAAPGEEQTDGMKRNAEPAAPQPPNGTMDDARNDAGASAPPPAVATTPLANESASGFSSGETKKQDKSTSERSRALKAEAPAVRPHIILSVIDSADAATFVEKTARELGGTILRKEAIAGGLDITVSLPAKRHGQFRDALKKAGEVRDSGSERAGERLVVRIIKAGTK